VFFTQNITRVHLNNTNIMYIEMCGILFILGTNTETDESMRRLENRGPEGSRLITLKENVGKLGFTRLAINGLNSEGMQPMSTGAYTWVCNGEIYNWRKLAKEYNIDIKSGSDCEVIGPLYAKFCKQGISLEEFFRALDGVFAVVIVDYAREKIIVARDPYGVRPLYYGFLRNDGMIGFASEMKALSHISSQVFPFKPGHYQEISFQKVISEEVRYHPLPLVKNPSYVLTNLQTAIQAVRTALTVAVQKRMMTERPVACLLSGGLDSSTIAALVSKELRLAGAPPLRTFSIGMKGSSDLMYAKKVAEWIGSQHTEVIMTADDFFAAVPAVIKDIESYDTTTVRASVGNWLVAKAVAGQSDCKVLFNGDGADEVWGSYLYFYSAPSDHAFEEETTRLLTDIHMFDVLRSDRCISSHGLEPRTPYLDKEFVAVCKAMATSLRRPMKGIQCEKWLMRQAFRNTNLLPEEVLWRTKEAFSDGVSGEGGKSWYQHAQEKALEVVGKEWEKSECPTAEQYYYKKCYLDYYPKSTLSTNVPYKWMPRWSPDTSDPSARTLSCYSSISATA
jgi:asparagine synthase (glutamine-hydrolysing)